MFAQRASCCGPTGVTVHRAKNVFSLSRSSRRNWNTLPCHLFGRDVVTTAGQFGEVVPIQ